MMNKKINAICFITRGVSMGDCDVFHVLVKYVVLFSLLSMFSAAVFARQSYKSRVLTCEIPLSSPPVIAGSWYVPDEP